MRLGIVSAMAVLVLAACAASASAADTVIRFDGLAGNTHVVDQYEGEGVQFGHPFRFGVGAGYANPSCTGGEGSPGDLYVDARTGISGPSGIIGCGSNEFSDGYDFAMAFAYWRHGVSFAVRAMPWVGDVGSPQPLTVRLLDRNGVILEQHAYDLPVGQVVPLAYSRRQSDIAYVDLMGDGHLWIDDIVAPIDAVPPAPEYRLALTTPTLDLVEGATGSVPVRVIRFNGSTGPVGVDVAALPAGISAASVDPNPLGGTASGALRLTAASPAGGDRQVSVSAAPGAPASAGRPATAVPVTVTVRLAPALTMDRATSTAVPRCGSSGDGFFIGVRGGYSGRVGVSIEKVSGPATAGAISEVTAAGSGSVRVPIFVSSETAAPSPSIFNVRLTPIGATPVNAPLAVYTDPVRVDGIDNSLIVPNPLTTIHQQIVRGSFPSSCSVRFRDDGGTDLPTQGTVSGGPGQSEGLRVGLGADPITTAIHVVRADNGVELAATPRFTVRDYRNSSALSGVNGGDGAKAASYTWDDFVATFGRDDADSCFLDYCWRDGLAEQYYNQYRGNVTAGGGLCWGWSNVSVGFDTGDDLPRVYTPGASRAWDVAPLTDGTAIKREIVKWQVRWFDRGNVLDYNNQRANPLTAASLRARLEQLLGNGTEPVLAIWASGGGHAVVATDVRGTPADGGFDIVTYNPNWPYQTAEESSAATRTANLTASVIHVTPSGIWSGGISGWSNNLANLQVFDHRPAVDATLPTDVTMTAPGAGGAGTIGQISVGGRGTLNGDGSVRTGNGVTDLSTPTGGSPEPAYGLASGRSYQVEMRGTRSGTYEQSMLGDGVAATIAGVQTRSGQRDAVTLTPGRPRLAFAGSGSPSPARLELLARVGGGSARSAAGRAAAHPQRTADVELTVGGGRTDAVSFTGGARTLELRHGGPAMRAAITLGSAGEGAPTSVSLAPLRVGAGERLQLKPTSWSDPGAGVAYTLRNARGRVVRRGQARVKPTTRVRIARGLTVKTTPRRRGGGGRVTVSGRVQRAGGSPLLVVSVQVLRRGRPIARGVAAKRGTAQVRNGRFSLPVALRRLPRGARLRVVATLTDEAANFATARAGRQATVRR